MKRSHGRKTGGPRSWRTRGAVAMRATGWSYTEQHGRILKGLYPPFGRRKPKWAADAYDRHWITLAEYLLVDFETGPGPFEMFYESSPFFALLKKTSFAPETTT